jgi:hypothetical protein
MTRAPLNPRLVLLVAMLLPGMGHVLSGAARRGITLQLFMIAGAFITWHLSTPQTSLAGRLAGGLFVYALSLPEAYRLAKLRAVTVRSAAA